jgi:hypothetical protein
MKRKYGTRPLFARLALGLGVAVLGTASLEAQVAYQSASNGNFHMASPIPTQMASPLAGGPAAAQGGDFMDAHGNPIIMPASYCPPGPGACYPGGPGGGAYGDPMAVDFGGYTEDQIGPHYYDVSFGTVFLKSDKLFAGIGPLASVTVGPAAPKVLDPGTNSGQYEAGWNIALRYDLGALSVFEAAYMGLYDIGFQDTVNSTEATTTPPNQPNQLYTVFSNFGVPVPIDGLDDGETYTTTYKSDLQSTELSYRRYWVGNNPRISGTYLLGFRYVRLTENFDFDAQALLGNSLLHWGGSNDLLGFQIGGDGWLGLRQGLRVGCEGKAGVYNNRFEFDATGNFPADIQTAPDDYAAGSEGDQVAFVGEAGVQMVADILPSWSLRGGYHVFYIDNLATVTANFDTSTFVPANLSSKADVLYHGFSAGAEYVW